MSRIEWTNDRGFSAVGTIDGEPLASVTMREPGTYVAVVRRDRRWFETEQDAYAWCEEMLSKLDESTCAFPDGVIPWTPPPVVRRARSCRFEYAPRSRRSPGGVCYGGGLCGWFGLRAFESEADYEKSGGPWEEDGP